MFASDRTADYACSSLRGCGHPARSMSSYEEGCAAMLVLTRKSNQSIMIGDDIEVSVLSVMGDKVRIGIRAPQDIPVFRTEIYLEIQRDGAHSDSGSGEGPDGGRGGEEMPERTSGER
jgi:carbon storage regulator